MAKAFLDATKLVSSPDGETLALSAIPAADIGKATAAVAASKVFGSSTSVVTLTAKTAGAEGNDIALELIDPAADGAIAVSVQGQTIQVKLAKAGGNLTTTGAQLQAAINGNADAFALVAASAGGAGVMAEAFDNLEGGVDANNGAPLADHGIQFRNEARLCLLVSNASQTKDARVRVRTNRTINNLVLPDRLIDVPAASSVLIGPFAEVHQFRNNVNSDGAQPAYDNYVLVEFGTDATAAEYGGGEHNVEIALVQVATL